MIRKIKRLLMIFAMAGTCSLQPVIADPAVSNYLDLTPAEKKFANKLFNGDVSAPTNLLPFAEKLYIKLVDDPVLYAEWDRYMFEATGHGVVDHVAALDIFRAAYHAALARHSAQLEQCRQLGTYDPNWVDGFKKQLSPDVIKSHRSEIPIILQYLHALADGRCMERAEHDTIVREAQYHQAVVGYISDFSEFATTLKEPLRKKTVQRRNEINTYLGVMLKSSVARMLSLKERRMQLLNLRMRHLPTDLVEALSQLDNFTHPFDLPKAVADATRL